METLHKVKWLVSLSNGETFFEGKGKFVEIAGQRSPWQRLLSYTAQSKTTITSLSLYTDEGQTFNLPSAGNNPKFAPFRALEKPIDYAVRRHIANEASGSQDENGVKVGAMKMSDWFTSIVAIYPTHELQLWVDNQNTKNCWVLVT